MASILDYAKQAKKGGSRSILDYAKQGRKPFAPPENDDTEARVAALEQVAAETGARTPEQDSPGLFRRVVDVLSRPNYAVAGAAEELLTDRGGGLGAAAKRAGTELFSGIGGLKGQKEGFAQVMEQSGVGTGGSISDIMPWNFTETGEGLALQKSGPLDFTGRGVTGFLGDVFLDPTTYLTAGTSKGVAIFGKAIPGSARALQAMSKATKSTIKAVPAFDKALDAVGAVFNRDWKIRNLPGAVRLKQAHLNRQSMTKAAAYETLGRSEIAAIPRRRWADFVDAMDDGSWATKYADDPKMLRAAQEWKAMNAEMAGREVAADLLKQGRVKEHYAAHFYDNTPEELATAAAVSPWSRGPYNKATLGRHAEMRAFPTLKKAEEWTKAQHAIDPRVPILRPVRDPMKIMQQRIDAHVEALEFKKYYEEIKAAFGREDITTSLDDFMDLTKAVPVSDAEAVRIGELVSAGKTPLDEFGKLSTNGKREFVRNRLLKATAPGEIVSILRKYGPENAPKQTSLLGKLAEDGTPYVPFNIPALKGVEIPKSLADDLTEMSEKVIKSRELDHLLRYYDRANNTFKSFVTVMFPAFHVRNAYSNLSQGFADVGMSVLNPARHYDAYAAMRGLDGAVVTKAGESIPYKQLQQEMLEQGVTTTGRKMLEYTGREGIDRLATVGGKVKAAPRRVGQAIENEARAALYTVYRRRGMDAVSAGERVNQFLFDYSNLSRVEQDFFRRGIPFYTWMRKNLERQFRNLTTKPGYTATQIKAFRGREDENGMLTSWDAEALKLRLNRDGKTLRVLSGIDLPVRNLDTIWNGSLRGTVRQNLGMLSPILKAPIEIGAGASLFTGRPMDRTTSRAFGSMIEALDPPKGVKDWLGYTKTTDAAGRPRYEFDGEKFYIMFQSWALSRVVSTTDRQFRQFADDPSWGPVILDLLTGLRDRTLNLDEEQDRRLKERIRHLEDSLVRRGAQRRYESIYTPKKQPVAY